MISEMKPEKIGMSKICQGGDFLSPAEMEAMVMVLFEQDHICIVPTVGLLCEDGTQRPGEVV
jgi:hypothetical protein